MSKFKISVTMTPRKADQSELPNDFTAEAIDGDVVVDESEYVLDDVSIVADSVKEDGDGEVTFDVEVNLSRESGKFISNSDLAEAVMENIADEFCWNDEGWYDVQVEEA